MMLLLMMMMMIIIIIIIINVLYNVIVHQVGHLPRDELISSTGTVHGTIPLHSGFGCLFT